MARISVLPSTVADQIAAGEVVERPASVVKELVENALDAGATSIDVAVEEGGRTLVRVSDDGCGMDRDDAVLCLARHGTSKIRTSHDLTAVATFGFRGEALPAICSVARVTIETSLGESGAVGTHVRAEGGSAPVVSETARRHGTTVAVEQLFYNVPARLKFLRGARTEWRAIIDALTSLSLARRDVRLTVTHDGKPVLALPPAPTMRARLAALWGAKYAERVVDVEGVQGEIRVSGLIERPSDVGTATRRVFVSVNGRAVRDNGLVRAAELAYRSTIPAGTRPSLFLDVTVSPDTVDVNVHPAKAEVRFRDRWSVERAVETAVRSALGTAESSASFGHRFAGAFQRSEPVPIGTDVLSRPITVDEPLFTSARANVDESSSDAALEEAWRNEMAETPVAVRPTVSVANDPSIPPLVQLRRTFMLFEHEDGIVLIDQHSAHERVLYEEFMNELNRGGASSQRLLIPLTLHLEPTEATAFEEHREYFERLGFEIEPFGGGSLLVNAVPVPHPRFDAERCLRETLEALTGNRVTSTAPRHERLAATIACKAAVKAGDPLSQHEMRALFAALRDTQLPAHDVHGRSTIVQLSWNDVERRFGRQ